MLVLIVCKHNGMWEFKLPDLPTKPPLLYLASTAIFTTGKPILEGRDVTVWSLGPSHFFSFKFHPFLRTLVWAPMEVSIDRTILLLL